MPTTLFSDRGPLTHDSSATELVQAARALKRRGRPLRDRTIAQVSPTPAIKFKVALVLERVQNLCPAGERCFGSASLSIPLVGRCNSS